MSIRQHGSSMQSFNINHGEYPDVTPLLVRTTHQPTVSEHPWAPGDGGVVHEEQDFPVRWLRERDTAYDGVPLAAGLLLMRPCVLDFTFVGDETILLVSGAIDVVDTEGNVARLRTADMAYFAAGTSTTWTVLAESVELFTILG